MIYDQNEELSFKPVIISYDDWPEETDQMVSWCEINAQGNWSYGLHHVAPDSKVVYAFYFNNDHDWLGFKLTWGLH